MWQKKREKEIEEEEENAQIEKEYKNSELKDIIEAEVEDFKNEMLGDIETVTNAIVDPNQIHIIDIDTEIRETLVTVIKSLREMHARAIQVHNYEIINSVNDEVNINTQDRNYSMAGRAC